MTEAVVGDAMAAAVGACSLLAAVGCCLLIVSLVLVGRSGRASSASASPDRPSLSLLKPLCGDEPGLTARLLSMCDQDYRGEVEFVFGVQQPDDPAVAAVDELRSLRPKADITLVVDRRLHGSNRKVSNLINMAARARNDVLVVADSDIEVGPQYLTALAGALEGSDVGAVTCLYVGDAGRQLGAELSAAAINTHFLPGVVLGLALGAARPCFGATIALRRATLRAIGGFEAFANQLADDYAIGEAVRAAGLKVVIADVTVRHACAEPGVGSFFRHQLRSARTIRTIDPGGYAGSIVLNPWPFALLGTMGGSELSVILLVAAWACRLLLGRAMQRRFGAKRHAWWLLALSDLMLFAVFCASFCGRAVTWRGQRLRVLADGTALLG